MLIQELMNMRQNDYLLNVKVDDRINVEDKLLTLEATKVKKQYQFRKEECVVSIHVNPKDSVLEGDGIIEIGD